MDQRCNLFLALYGGYFCNWCIIALWVVTNRDQMNAPGGTLDCFSLSVCLLLNQIESMGSGAIAFLRLNNRHCAALQRRGFFYIKAISSCIKLCSTLNETSTAFMWGALTKKVYWVCDGVDPTVNTPLLKRSCGTFFNFWKIVIIIVTFFLLFGMSVLAPLHTKLLITLSAERERIPFIAQDWIFR